MNLPPPAPNPNGGEIPPELQQRLNAAAAAGNPPSSAPQGPPFHGYGQSGPPQQQQHAASEQPPPPPVGSAPEAPLEAQLYRPHQAVGQQQYHGGPPPPGYIQHQQTSTGSAFHDPSPATSQHPPAAAPPHQPQQQQPPPPPEAKTNPTPIQPHPTAGPQQQIHVQPHPQPQQSMMTQQQHVQPHTAPSGPALQPVPPPQLALQTSATPPQDNGGPMRGLRVEDALLYLDDVKHEFKGRPNVYNEFLGIMKNFKSQEVDTPGVIARVSKLFRGYNKLILGFNTFLPDGYKISMADLERQEAELRAQEAAAAAAVATGGGNTVGQFHQSTQAPTTSMQPLPASQQPQAPKAQNRPPKQQWQESAPPPKKKKAKQQQAPAAQQQQQQQQHGQEQPQQAVEFDHAISYVTTIKRRFVNDPSTYHQFLEILHTYQKEQRGIKEVLEQVAHLFQDHPDLLKEFTFFLPDAVQEQAKERLHRAAAESESRLAAQRQMYNRQQQKIIDMTSSQSRKRGDNGATSAESYVYNSAVERQFFDAAREAMSFSRDGGQAWAEFLKCLGLYANEVLSRTEMLNFVEPLLGKRNTKLFEEFKRILVHAGTPNAPLLEDAWYSVPLSEIDFSRCRRCSPSYRALPRDYPAPPCSDRNEMEAKNLNDIWVSLPVGSEESYTFRHMRRNTYEETLFRVEDERFEIDMVMGSNSATLKRLEPIAEEIAALAQEEQAVISDVGKTAPEGTGLAGKRFQYSFDDSVLGVIHRNAIRRLYGDHGQEMLELMVKNPSVVIPIVVDRLRQKNEEWIKVRSRLNRNWKALAEQNYFKSLDNRSLTWRTTDKRATSTRTMISEIKDRAENDGAESEESLRQKLDKAKEEHGSFYEVTKKDELSKTLDLTFLPKPDRRLFTPHLSILYEESSWVQQDAYRIMAFALERGSVSPSDKERCHRLWLEFFGPWFGLASGWMQKPAVEFMEAAKTAPVPSTATIVSEDDDESMEEAEIDGRVVTEEMKEPDDKGKAYVDYHPLPSGAPVTTLYGQGTILEYRSSENIYSIKLAFGATGFVRPATVLGSVLPVEKSAYTRELRSKDRTKLARPSDQLAIGTQTMYLFFRLHQILVRRLTIAKRLAYSVASDRSLVTMVERMEDNDSHAAGRRRYEAYLSLLYALLDGGVGGAAEGGKYEDRVRCLLGHGAYELGTMDKLISHLWKNLQSMAHDESTWNLIQLYRRHRDAGSFQPDAFRQEAAYLSAGEQVYAFQYCPVQGKDDAVLHIEYLGVIDEGSDEGGEEEPEGDAPPPKRQKR